MEVRSGENWANRWYHTLFTSYFLMLNLFLFSIASSTNSKTQTWTLSLFDKQALIPTHVHIMQSTESSASQVLNLRELASLIASCLDGEDLFLALRLNSTFQSIFKRDKAFWSRKLKSHGFTYSVDLLVTARQLRHAYQHQLRTIERIKRSKKPLQKSCDLRDHTSNTVLEGPRNMVLFFRSYKETGLTDIVNFGDLSHEGQPRFFPERIFAGGRLCLGWETRTQVIRKVDDWSLVVDQLDSPSEDCPLEYVPAKQWEISNPNWSELLCLHRKGANAGIVEVWDASVQNKLGEMFHPGLQDYLLVEETFQLVTASAEGLIKIWNLRNRSLAVEFKIDKYWYLKEVQRGILKIMTRDQTLDDPAHGAVYRMYDGSYLPQLLDKELSNPDYWITFSDGTHVVGVSSPTGIRICEFEILKHDGTKQGHFSHRSVKSITPFLDQFIVTVSSAGDLKIWSQIGEELSSQSLDYKYPTVVSDEQARLVVLSAFEGSFDGLTVFDFGAPGSELP